MTLGTRLALGIREKIKIWSPSEIKTLGWYDASYENSILHASNAVSKWIDLSGNNNHLTQLIELNKPKTNVRKINSRNVLDFDGSDLLSDPTFNLPTSGNLAVFQVTTIDLVNSVSDSIYSFKSNFLDDFQIISNNATQFDGGMSTSLGSPYTFTGGPYVGPDIHQTILDWTTASIITSKVNGSVVGSSTYISKILASSSFNTMTNRSTSQSLKGAVAEIIIVEDISSSNINIIEGYLAHKWGIASRLPSSHIYKNRKPVI